MRSERKHLLVAGAGELLWDIFPDRKTLGGAPSNFAYNVSCLGDQGLVVSAVGDDDLGREALRQLGGLGLSTDSIQIACSRPTGTVQVQLDPHGVPAFRITEDVAWDYLEWTPSLTRLASQVRAVCFGSLAQRSAASRATLQRFLRSTRKDAVRVFDINLRPPWYSEELLAASLNLADVVKLSSDELTEIAGFLDLRGYTVRSRGRQLLEAFQLDLVCVTLGAEGCLLIKSDEEFRHPGFRVKVVDTVGAGDAFLAGMVHFYLRGAPLSLVAEAGNRMGALAVTQPGGMSPEILQGAREISGLLETRE